MSFWWLSWVCGLVVLVFLFSVVVYIFSFSLGSIYEGLGVFCVFDDLGLIMSLLSLFVVLSLVCFPGWLVSCCSSRLLILLSGVFSVMCYNCSNALWFWVFYELSILPLLYLLIADSSYSDRYSAFWYFAGYLVFSSLPMLLCVVWFSLKCGSFSVVFWFISDWLDIFILLLLGVLFVAKIPLVPFHVWLPLVHAEASSFVSACLSGYIMKLGVVGICRFCLLVSDYLFSYEYVFMLLLSAVLFFFLSLVESDCKRWLAFLSLGHIVLVSFGMSLCAFGEDGYIFLFCLGHGLSACFMFLLLSLFSVLQGTRCLFLMKGSFSSGLVVRVVSVCAFCLVGSFPPSIQFFCEIWFLCAGLISVVLVSLFLVYVFVGGLVPLVTVGLFSVRNCSYLPLGVFMFGVFPSLVFLVFWSSVIFVVL